MNNNPLEQISKLKPIVWKKIQEYLPNKEPIEHYKMVREYPIRQGKYLRPGLILLSAQMFGEKINQALLAAAAMQVCEDWILIHDDIQDHSMQRRHKPSLNILYGDELAINAGDALHVIMWRILADNVNFLGPKVGWRIYEKMNKIIMTTIEGQFLELNLIKKNKIDINEQEYYKMIDIKAGYYTIVGPLQLGAMVAGKNTQELAKIKEWGIYFGRAFQIWDDVMNLTVSSALQGKEIAGDILEGKRTLILIYTLKKANKSEKDEIIKIYTKKRENKTEKEKNYILNLMKKYGSIEFAKNKARNYAKQAKEIFDENTNNLPNSLHKQTIRDLIDFVVNRDK